MKHCNKFRWLIGILSLAAVVAATVAAVVVYLEKKKKDEEDLEHYLDCSVREQIYKEVELCLTLNPQKNA